MTVCRRIESTLSNTKCLSSLNRGSIIFHINALSPYILVQSAQGVACISGRDKRSLIMVVNGSPDLG